MSVSEGLVEDTAAGRFRTNIMVAQSAYERENTGEKVTKKRLSEAERGYWLGGYIPFGYDHDKKEKRLVLNQDEKKIVQRIYELAAALVPLTKIAEQLNAEGVRTRIRTLKSREGVVRNAGGVKVRSDWLRQVIRKPLYKGRIVCQGGDFVGKHAPIVSAELWHTANAAIQQTLKPARCRQPRRDRHFNVLKGLIFCGECGRAMVPHASGKVDNKGNHYRYYTCDKVIKDRSDASCRVRRVSGPAIESCIVALLGQMAQRPEVLQGILAAGKSGNETRQREWAKKLRTINAELNRITLQLDNFLDALGKDGLNGLLGELRERIAQLASRRDVLLVERARVQQDLDHLSQETLAPGRLVETLGKFGVVWAGMTADEKRELVNLAVARVSVRAERSSAATADSAVIRSLQLTVKLHLPESLSASDSSPGLRKRKLLSLESSVQLPANGIGEIQIHAPFKHSVGHTGKMASAKISQPTRELPLERAIRWSKLLQSKAALSARTLARKAGVSEATMSMTLALMGLSPEVRDYILANREHRAVRHMGLRMLGKLASKSPAEQQAAVAAVMSRWARIQ